MSSKLKIFLWDLTIRPFLELKEDLKNMPKGFKIMSSGWFSNVFFLLSLVILVFMILDRAKLYSVNSIFLKDPIVLVVCLFLGLVFLIKKRWDSGYPVNEYRKYNKILSPEDIHRIAEEGRKSGEKIEYEKQ